MHARVSRQYQRTSSHALPPSATMWSADSRMPHIQHDVTSGAPSPTLGKPIAMAYVEGSLAGPFWIDVRGKEEPAAVTELPFYKRGK